MNSFEDFYDYLEGKASDWLDEIKSILIEKKPGYEHCLKIANTKTGEYKVSSTDNLGQRRKHMESLLKRGGENTGPYIDIFGSIPLEERGESIKYEEFPNNSISTSILLGSRLPANIPEKHFRPLALNYINFLISKDIYNFEEKYLEDRKKEIVNYISQNHKEFRTIPEILENINKILSL